MGTESQGLDWEIIDGAVTFYLDFIKELKFRLKLEVNNLFYILQKGKNFIRIKTLGFE